MDPAKLKVVDLRTELSKRGLDSKGNKAVLVERLKQALDEEKESAPPKKQTEDEASESEEEQIEQRKLPTRSSRRSTREVTSATTPTRRSSSRSSNRQSPAKQIQPEVEAAIVLEPIIEEDKTSPKKDVAAIEIEQAEGPSPAKKDKRDSTMVTSSKIEVPSPESSPSKSESVTEKETAVSSLSPRKESVSTKIELQSPRAKLEIVKEAERLMEEPSQQITKCLSEDLQKAHAAMSSNIESKSPVKQTQSLETNLLSPGKGKPTQSPLKEVESAAMSPTKTHSPMKHQSPIKADPTAAKAQSPVQSPLKPQVTVHSPEKPQPPVQSPVKSECTVESPAKSQPTALSPAKSLPTALSPAKSQSSASSPAKAQPLALSPSKSQSSVQSSEKNEKQNESVDGNLENTCQSSEKINAETPNKTSLQSPLKKAEHSPVKTPSPQKKIEQSPEKRSSSLSPTKKQKKDGSEPMETEDAKSIDSDKNDSKPMETNQQDDKSGDRKRKRSPSPQENTPRAPPVARPENEPILKDDEVLLSWYDSDLHLVLNSLTYLAASPMQGDGFNYMWAGARISHGFSKGKVCYEAKVSSEFNNMAGVPKDTTGALPADDEKIPSLMRLGWSVIGTSLQLGEEKLSYGYEGTGKKCTNNEFVDYGKAFAKDDIVCCYADFETEDETITLSYSINGESQGPAFVIKKEDLMGKALFPHILGRNCTITMNVGQEEPWTKDILDGYQFIKQIDPKDRTDGPRRPTKREDCEVILLCGLPFSGKTNWSLKHNTENPDKLYNILGLSSLIDKMKVEGKPLRDTFKGRWETVVEKCSRALGKLLESAPSRRRNYILDQQANVYGSTQKRKMRNFYGFHRKAVVLVFPDDEFKARFSKRKEEPDGEEIRESSILEVKASLSAPVVGESFEEVIWPELNEEEGKKLIELYNSEGKTAGYGQNQQQQSKRSRYDNNTQKDRNNRDSRDRRPPFNDNSRRSSGWQGGRGGQSGNNWSNNRMRNAPPMRHGYNSPGNWRGGGRPLPRGGGNNSHRQGNDRRNYNYQGNAAYGSQGGWHGPGYSSGGSGNWSGQQSYGGSGWKNANNYSQSYGNWGSDSQYYSQPQVQPQQQSYWSSQPSSGSSQSYQSGQSGSKK